MSNPQDSPLQGVAIVGMAGRFPGAANVETFWRNLRAGKEGIRFFSEAELIAAGISETRFRAPGYVAASGFVPDIEQFDAAFFGFSPRDAESTDPQHRLFLECAWEALESAGYDPGRFDGPIGVYGGCGSNHYLWRHVLPRRGVNDLIADFPLMIGSEKDFLATRVSYKLGLRGPGLTVQTACSTSLVAVCLAWQALMTHQCEMALAGGVTLNLESRYGYLHREGLIFSADGHCRAFDAAAQGTVPGDGVGIVVLKRLEDAVADRDTIYAVLRGAAINNDGNAKLGFAAPSIAGQSEVIAQALALADVAPETVSYIEAHGTGTPLGDPIEIAALREAYSGVPPGSIAIGSVKTNIGHLDTAAGVTGLIKAALSIHHAELPPTLHFASPNPKLGLEDSPFYVNTALSPWTAPQRRAGVSSFGMGGTNAHVILEAPPVAPIASQHEVEQGAELLVISARSATALDNATHNLARHLAAHKDCSLADVAYTLQVGRRAFDHRRTLSCRSIDEAVQTLSSPGFSGTLTRHDAQDARPVAFLFPGQGNQHLDLGRDLYASEPIFRQWLDVCSTLLIPYIGIDLRAELFATTPSARAAADERLRMTSLVQPLVFSVEYALARMWIEWGIKPAALLGHSIGEYVAACLAGVFSLEDALWLVAQRGQLMQHLPAGAMLAIPLSRDAVEPLLETPLSLAAVNGPSLSVVAGPSPAVMALQETLRSREIDSKILRTSHAFHSAMMDPVLAPFRACVERVKRQPPQVPFVSNVTGTWITREQATSPAYWAQHLRETVQFAACLETLFKKPELALLEVWPAEVLTQLILRNPARPVAQPVVSTLSRRGPSHDGSSSVLSAVGQLWTAGVTIDWTQLHRGSPRHRIPLPTYPFERQRLWLSALPERSAATEISAPRTVDDPDHGAVKQAAPTGNPVQQSASRRPALKQPYVDPRGELEHRLAVIWGECLGLDRVGRDDGLFELGGDSLLAVQLLRRIKTELHVELSAHELLHASTIAALGQVIERRGSVDSDGKPRLAQHTPLVEIQRGDGRPPLYLVHPVGGHVYVYRALASCLGDAQGVYGLQAQGVDGELEPLTSISEMAAQYVAAVRAHQPEGPYHLGGASFGGLVAYEMAQLLIAQRQQVAIVAMLDTAAPCDVPRSLNSDAAIVAYLVEMGALDPSLASELRTLTAEEMLVRFIQNTGQSSRLLPPMPPEQLGHFLKLWRLGLKAMSEYVAAPCGCPVVFFRAAQHDAVNIHAPERGWRSFVRGSFDVFEVPGNHITMTYPPNVQHIADLLARYLRKS